jgi:DNA-binding winged helix-turn-helix (wHTH) protein
MTKLLRKSMRAWQPTWKGSLHRNDLSQSRYVLRNRRSGPLHLLTNHRNMILISQMTTHAVWTSG